MCVHFLAYTLVNTFTTMFTVRTCSKTNARDFVCAVGSRLEFKFRLPIFLLPISSSTHFLLYRRFLSTHTYSRFFSLHLLCTCIKNNNTNSILLDLLINNATSQMFLSLLLLCTTISTMFGRSTEHLQ